MRRAATSAAILLAALAAAAPARAQAALNTGPSTGPDAAMDRYLAERGLTSLRFELLWDRLQDAPEESRGDLVAEASALLSRLLGSESDPERQREWQERAKELLRLAEGAAAMDLELRLLRASYQRAERAAERWRLRTGTDAEAAAAVRAFTDAAASLERIARQAGRRVEAYESRLEGAVGEARDRLRERAAEHRSTRSQAHYLAGWCRLYMAQMKRSRDDARDALANFAWLLGAPDEAEPDPDNVSPSTLSLDHVTRAAIGTAAAYAELGRAPLADEWLAAADTHAGPGARDAVESWRLVIDASLERWDALMSALEANPDPAAARLVAVSAVEALSGRALEMSRAQRALETALESLIDLGDSASLVDLSRRYGALPISGRGFLARYTKGVGLYLDAESRFRASGLPSDEPAPAGPHRLNFQTAARALAEAVDAGDAAERPSALAEAKAVLGAALFYASGSNELTDPLARAQEHLAAAVDHLPDPERRAGALWLAIRSARLRAENSAGASADAAEATREADELAARFLREFPQHELAGVILYEMAMREGIDPRRRAELLRRVPPTSSAAGAARDQSARALYEVFRAADAAGRTPAALRYLDAAEPLLADDLTAAGAGEGQAASRALARARRMLDALLAMTPPDVDRARTVLARAGDLPGATEPDARLELAYRRAQVALASGDAAGADEAVARLEALAQGDERAERYAVALRRFVFRRAVSQHQSVREANAASEAVARAARRVVAAGRALLRDDADMDEPAALSASLYLAEALDDLARYDGDEDARRAALDIRLEALERRPADADLLRDVAQTAELVGRDAVARDAWNRRLALLPVGSEEWFRARYRQLRHLAAHDPDEARRVLRRQHRVLYPEYGPGPWGPRLRALDESLGDDRPAAGDDR